MVNPNIILTKIIKIAITLITFIVFFIPIHLLVSGVPYGHLISNIPNKHPKAINIPLDKISIFNIDIMIFNTK